MTIIRKFLPLSVLILGLGVSLIAQPAVNFLNARFSLDSNGALLVAMNGYGGSQGPATNIANTRVKVDSNGALITTLGGAAGTVNVNGIATTSTDGMTIQNVTASTVGVPVQMSPRVKLCGSAWNSVGAASETDCWIIEALPATVAGTTTSSLRIGDSINGGAFGNDLILGSGAGSGTGLTIASSVTSTGGNFSAAAAGSINFASRVAMKSTADKLFSILDTAQATGLEFNMGTPTLGTCTGGSITSGSHNGAGEVTGNTSGSCIINFGAPNFTNTPFCFTNDETSSIIAPNVSARSASSITIAGQASGNAFQWFCIGRIGT